MHGSKSSLLDDGTRELAGQVRGPLPSRSIRELAGPPASPPPGANVQELDERNGDEPLETLGKLAAELNHRLELQKQKKEERGCGPTGALWGPPAVRPVSGGGPTSGFYGPQVVRPKLEQEVHGCGPSDSVLRSNRTGDPVCRSTNDGAWPAEQHLQQYR